MTNEPSFGHGHDEGIFFIRDIAGNEKKNNRIILFWPVSQK